MENIPYEILSSSNHFLDPAKIILPSATALSGRFVILPPEEEPVNPTIICSSNFPMKTHGAEDEFSENGSPEEDYFNHEEKEATARAAQWEADAAAQSGIMEAEAAAALSESSDMEIQHQSVKRPRTLTRTKWEKFHPAFHFYSPTAPRRRCSSYLRPH